MAIIEMFATKSPCWKANANRADYRYRRFQDNGPKGLMLHSVGCAQPSAEVFINRWNREDNNSVMCHAVIDANDGNARQALKWNYRGWHAGGDANNTHIGVEMCESSYIRYLEIGEAGYAPGKFEIKDKTKAQKHCKTAYNGAVELFATLCIMFNLNPMTAICSHKEGNAKGIASAHADPEHYWTGLGMTYTMNGFRSDVKKKIAEMQTPKMPFTDVKEGTWYYEHVLRCYQEGMMTGKSSDKFKPMDNLTRAEAAAIICRILDKTGGK